MNRARKLTVGLCIAAAIGLAWGLSWFTHALMADSYPGEPAYDPVANMPPPVDLKSVQRGWPTSLTTPGDRVRLAAYMRRMESQSPPPVAAPSAAAAPAALDLGTLLASADPAMGKSKAQVCLSCHNFQQGGADGIGPNLWGVIGRDVASRPGFAYSPAMAAQAGSWSYARLFAYLASPARAVPGNKMGFAGMRRPEDRAAVLSYLATLSASPPPFPQSSGQATNAR